MNAKSVQFITLVVICETGDIRPETLATKKITANRIPCVPSTSPDASNGILSVVSHNINTSEILSDPDGIQIQGDANFTC